MNRAFVGVKDVAAAAGVSVGTVSNVLNNPTVVADKTVAKVHKAIDELGFVRNDAARQLRAGLSRSVGLVVLDVGNPFFTDLARGAENSAAEAGLSVLLGNSAESVAREDAYLDLFEQQHVRGLLISPVGDTGARLRMLRSRGIPSVLVDRQAGLADFSSVSVDDVAGGRIATRHLIDRGRRRLAFVGGPMSLRQVADRLAGARHVVGDVPGASLDVVETESLTIQHGRTAAEHILDRNTGDLPDAVFAANDLVAVGIVQAFIRHGPTMIPDDVFVVGYDDIEFAKATVVPITSVRQPREMLGRKAFDLLRAEVDSLVDDIEPTHHHVVFDPELVVRESTGG